MSDVRLLSKEARISNYLKLCEKNEELEKQLAEAQARNNHLEQAASLNADTYIALEAERDTLRRQLAEARPALEWALYILDLYDERLATIDPPELVYSKSHVAAKAKAEAALAKMAAIPPADVQSEQPHHIREKFHADGDPVDTLYDEQPAALSPERLRQAADLIEVLNRRATYGTRERLQLASDLRAEAARREKHG